MDLHHLFDHEIDFPPVLPPTQSTAPAETDGRQGPRGPDTSAQPDRVDQITRLFPGGGGVFLLTDEHDRLVHLGASGDLRRALRTRLLPPLPGDQPSDRPPTRPRADLAQITRKIRWRTAYSMFEVDYLYYQIARELIPDHYLDHLAFGPAWFAHLDLSHNSPAFVSAKSLRSPPTVDLGPFATQADANRFIEILQDAFDLCRYPHILEQAPDGTPCAYAEMGRCPAPCDGSVPMSVYRQMVSAALAFALGERGPAFETWQAQMQEAAGRLAYEKAGAIKQRIERARGIEHAAFRWVRPIEEFCYLILQRGRGRTWVKPFFVLGGWIRPGQAVKLGQVDGAVAAWVGEVRGPGAKRDGPAGSKADRRRLLSEQVWLVSHYLFRREPPGLFMHTSELGAPTSLVERIRERFSPRSTSAGADGSSPPGLPSPDAPA